MAIPGSEFAPSPDSFCWQGSPSCEFNSKTAHLSLCSSKQSAVQVNSGSGFGRQSVIIGLKFSFGCAKMRGSLLNLFCILAIFWWMPIVTIVMELKKLSFILCVISLLLHPSGTNVAYIFISQICGKVPYLNGSSLDAWINLVIPLFAFHGVLSLPFVVRSFGSTVMGTTHWIICLNSIY